MNFFIVSCVLFTLADTIELSGSSPPRPRASTTDLSSQNNNELNTTTTSKLSSHFEPTTSSIPELIVTATIRIPIRKCCTTPSSRRRNRILTEIGSGLRQLPPGYPEAQTLTVAYNNIKDLPGFVFWNNSYTGLRKIDIQHNRISNVNANAFKGVRHLKILDVSDNNVTTLDPYTFKSNSRLQKLIMMNNAICFDRLQTFILSHSIEYLILSNNRIDQIYELTFLGLPNLRTLMLNDNEIYGIAPNSFRTLNKLHYLSLANTGVYRLGESMFSRIPRILNLEGTPLGSRFEPPLRKVTGESVLKLLSLSRVMIDENYFTAVD